MSLSYHTYFKNFKWHLNNKSPQPGNNSPEIFSFCSCPNMSSGIKMPSYKKNHQNLPRNKKKSLKSAQGAKMPARLPKRAPGRQNAARMPKCAPRRQNARPRAQNPAWVPKSPPHAQNTRPGA